MLQRLCEHLKVCVWILCALVCVFQVRVCDPLLLSFFCACACACGWVYKTLKESVWQWGIGLRDVCCGIFHRFPVPRVCLCVLVFTCVCSLISLSLSLCMPACAHECPVLCWLEYVCFVSRVDALVTCWRVAVAQRPAMCAR